MLDVALLVLRLVLAVVFIGHGAQKLFGWFGGHGISGTAAFFEQIGYRPGRALAVIGGVAELGAGILMGLGLLTPLAAAIIIAMMVATLAVHAPHGFWAANGGFELPFVLAGVAAALAIAGSGTYGLDGYLGLIQPDWVLGVASIALGVVLGLYALARRQRMLEEAPTVGTELQQVA
ncbi:MAG: hypothetical protein KatS3mg011_0488 [Acidimicrobiia bacterium]|nr:MAG: hypothetical protein KatS3mg011_0488 [Acidimicrobiia bacterium]